MTHFQIHMLDGFHLALAAGFADCCVVLFIFRLGSGQAALRAPDPTAPPAPSLSPGGGNPGSLHLCGPLSLHVSIPAPSLPYRGLSPSAKLGVGCRTCRPSPTWHWPSRRGSVSSPPPGPAVTHRLFLFSRVFNTNGHVPSNF